MGHCQLSRANYNGGAAGIVADATAINANPANLSVPVIVGIVVGAVVGVALLVGIIVFLVKRPNKTEIV
jgi:F0F1-type ATP synthase assembly protein I